MTNSVALNQPIETAKVLFGSDNMKDFGNRVQTCWMEGDSMQPTIKPSEVVAFVDCGGRVVTSGIYIFSRNVIGRRCIFIKRIEPLNDGVLNIISDSHHYKDFTLALDEQNDMQIHGRVVAALEIRTLS
ncbi:helix-turn-helix transcriptional regulator [Lelliottia amnigena]|uniref:S24 family peptidase n=1 Tax=Lelliottia amnigena TaxID=61646 RepID=UPI001F21206C|nr:S24 family peptidase [Lelliottia amnigena]UJD93749.1 helix-turn-helix transcriptional regulator [Lelliottia amnigena]